MQIKWHISMSVAILLLQLSILHCKQSTLASEGEELCVQQDLGVVCMRTILQSISRAKLILLTELQIAERLLKQLKTSVLENVNWNPSQAAAASGPALQPHPSTGYCFFSYHFYIWLPLSKTFKKTHESKGTRSLKGEKKGFAFNRET